MSIFGYFAHKTTKKNLSNKVKFYSGLNSDQKGFILLNLWVTRGIDLASVSGVAGLNVPIYHYAKSAEVPLLELMESPDVKKQNPMLNALTHHFYTNLYSSYPDKGYRSFIVDLWGELYEQHTYLGEVAEEVFGSSIVNVDCSHIPASDVTLVELASDPKSIKPHFLIPGHPLSIDLLETE